MRLQMDSWEQDYEEEEGLEKFLWKFGYFLSTVKTCNDRLWWFKLQPLFFQKRKTTKFKQLVNILGSELIAFLSFKG